MLISYSDCTTVVYSTDAVRLSRIFRTQRPRNKLLLPPSINHDFNFTVVLIKKLEVTRIICVKYLFSLSLSLYAGFTEEEDTAKGTSCPGAI